MIFFLLFFLTSAAFAETSDTAVSNPGEFQIEPGLLEKLYQKSRDAVEKQAASRETPIAISPEVNVVSANRLSLQNDYFRIDHRVADSAFTQFGIAVSLPLARFDRLDITFQPRVLYSYREGQVSVNSQSGFVANDLIRLHWLPVEAGFRFEYSIPGISEIRPWARLGAGAQWLSQSGRLDGLEQAFWIPFYEGAAGLTFFPRSQTQGGWFGGVTAGFSWQESFASSQTVAGQSLHLGLNVFL